VRDVAVDQLRTELRQREAIHSDRAAGGRVHEKLVAAMKTRKWATRSPKGTDIGPQARPDLRDELHTQ
jgi:hypothetical protein